jgi:geranylgeranylglycerol-phosphate geranylgeranyltransferase
MTELTRQRRSTVSASILLLRPGSVAASAGICLIGAYLARPIATGLLVPGMVAVGAAVACSNVFNDISDLEADRINVPQRPLPSQAVSIPVAWGLCVGLVLIALAGGLLVSRPHGVWVGLVLALSFGYSLGLKSVLVLGGLVVGALLGNALMFGASLGSGLTSAVILGSLEIALFTFGREALKGVRDIEGDRSVGVSTIANSTGPAAAIGTFVAACLGVTALAAMARSWPHLAVMGLLVTLPGVAIGLRSLSSGDNEPVRDAIRQSSWLWATGLLGVAVLGV